MKKDATQEISRDELLACLGIMPNDNPASIARILVARAIARVDLDPPDGGGPDEEAVSESQAMLRVALRFAQEAEMAAVEPPAKASKGAAAAS